jgi:hypothetical protein
MITGGGGQRGEISKLAQCLIDTKVSGNEYYRPLTQTKKYDSKSKHCGARSDLGTTRAKVGEALSEVR